ncbi:MAG: response regulator [Chloroflexi bacterium]|nr:response regulator [Chloroflexota bacterium]
MRCISLNLLLAYYGAVDITPIARHLDAAGFSPNIDSASSYAMLIEKLKEEAPDIALIHQSLLPIALETPEQLREAAAATPILVLAATDAPGLDDLIEALGASGYVTEEEMVSPRLLSGMIGNIMERQALLAEKRDLEERRQQSERLLALGELAGGMAHDLNNNIAAILLSLQLLARNIRDDKLLAEIRSIEQAANDAAETIRRVRDEMEKRARRLFTEIDIDQVVMDVVAAAERHAASEAKVTGKEIRFATRLGQVPLIKGSASELREALTNVIRNAVEAIPEAGEVSVETQLKGGRVIISVSDTGVGIPEAIQDRIFDAFFTTKGSPGHGLGLNIVSGIVQRHDGQIALESAPGLGTTLSLSLPAIGISEEQARPRSSGTPGGKVLILEEAQTAHALRGAIAAAGYKVDYVSDGEDAIRAFVRSKHDIVITGFGMAGLGGCDIIKAIKAIDHTVYCILLTKWDATPSEQAVKDAAVDMVIEKPFDLDHLIHLISAAFLHRVISAGLNPRAGRQQAGSNGQRSQVPFSHPSQDQRTAVAG